DRVLDPHKIVPVDQVGGHDQHKDHQNSQNPFYFTVESHIDHCLALNALLQIYERCCNYLGTKSRCGHSVVGLRKTLLIFPEKPPAKVLNLKGISTNFIIGGYHSFKKRII